MMCVCGEGGARALSKPVGRLCERRRDEKIREETANRRGPDRFTRLVISVRMGFRFARGEGTGSVEGLVRKKH